MTDKLSNLVRGLRNRHFLLLDASVFLITPLIALKIRLDEGVAIEPYLPGLIAVTILFLLVKMAVLYNFRFYSHCWRYAGLYELEQIGSSMIVTGVAEVMIFKIIYLHHPIVNNLPHSLPLLDGILSFLIIGSIRFSVPVLERISKQHKKFHRRDRALIVGAGSAGVSLVKNLQQNPQVGLYPVAFIDDDPKKFNLQICGINVVGNHNQIPKIVRSLHIHRVIIAMPSASGKVIREIVDICQSNKILTSTLPAIHEIIYSRTNAGNIREVQIEDLLRREPIQTDIEKVSQLLQGKKVLVTGAGGSIGSELCRQIFKCNPAQIIILGHGENSVFTIEQELQSIIKSLKNKGEEPKNLPQITALIADLRMLPRLKYVFETFHPEVVFHAAAHKHVPMMELNPPEAITNNVWGTKNLLDLVLHYDVQNFVMISTDKAVNPTNIMGASKRVAEMLVLRAAQKSGKPFVVVRFGNVLGSRGSVVPTFKNQIIKGGPITITHPEICRYFMTIPEAVQLVLQASVLGRGGEVFMLDMGKPVKIVDLAKDLIRLSGLEVGKDIDITFTGLRPGEKLYEELFIQGEQYNRTRHEKILTAENASRIVPDSIDTKVDSLCQAAEQNNSNLIVFLLEQLVPEYTPGYSTVHLHTLENDLKRAIECQEFQIYYQPIMRLETDEMIGFEALLRWQHPEHGLVFPADFISVAEETGLIIPIGWWVMREACRQMSAWQQQYCLDVRLSMGVNLSTKQFFHANLITEISKILEETKLNPSNLRLEIPETVLTQNLDLVTSIFSKLKFLGVQLQIDNVQLANSSLNYLYNLTNSIYGQIDSLKMNCSLIQDFDSKQAKSTSIEEIISISQELGVSLIATSVETVSQITQLKSLRCAYGQGYFFSKPVESTVAKTLIEAKAVLNSGH
ncbi:capsule biosynthesis protein CapD [[Phormidium ambiguum] IAM M-71]|uniref:Capsule biosynthesis protein CapD n=1 Tax=[Phormidium ambiguum] IAM M-71 TaxID=454136 RepID=A0A1U7ILH8_9CYAN|nr:polysaccharide biosynthesis protein [Phormidium ambiguum]OKH38066.1 capsule biosynthesis protein CapD [Phormidium ambiguum IAM M-71]